MFLRVAEDHKYANLFFFHLRNKGVFLLEGFPTYMTAAHTDAGIDYCIAAFRESIAEMQEGGFFEVPAGIEVPHLNGSRLTGPPRQLDHVSPLSLPPANRSSLALPREPILYPMTESLAEIWLASQISENASRCFNEINTITLRGSLKIEALKTSLQDLVDRHDAKLRRDRVRRRGGDQGRRGGQARVPGRAQAKIGGGDEQPVVRAPPVGESPRRQVPGEHRAAHQRQASLR